MVHLRTRSSSDSFWRFLASEKESTEDSYLGTTSTHLCSASFSIERSHLKNVVANRLVSSYSVLNIDMNSQYCRQNRDATSSYSRDLELTPREPAGNIQSATFQMMQFVFGPSKANSAAAASTGPRHVSSSSSEYGVRCRFTHRNLSKRSFASLAGRAVIHK